MRKDQANVESGKSDERAQLEAELAALDKEMHDLEALEKQQEQELKQFEEYGSTIQSESASFWTKFNEYEKQLSINENSRSQMAAKTQF